MIGVMLILGISFFAMTVCFITGASWKQTRMRMDLIVKDKCPLCGAKDEAWIRSDDDAQ